MHRKELLLPFLAAVCILFLRSGAQRSGRYVEGCEP